MSNAMQPLLDSLKPWQEKMDALQTRERVLLFSVAAVVLVMLMQTLLLDPLLKQTAQIKRQHQQAENLIAQKKIEKQQLEMILAAGVNRAKMARRDQLEVEWQKLEQKIQSSLLTLIPPQMMPQVLEKVLLKNDKLKLMALENLPVVPLIEQQQNPVTGQSDAQAKVANADRQGLYKHSFVIRLEGSYPAAVEYFESLSELPWRFNWDALHYQVSKYPKASISLEVHTVSLSEDWIGV